MATTSTANIDLPWSIWLVKNAISGVEPKLTRTLCGSVLATPPPMPFKCVDSLSVPHANPSSAIHVLIGEFKVAPSATRR